MRNVSWLTMALALGSLVLFIGLVFLRVPFPPYPLLNWQDVFDLLTPLVLIPIYWALFRLSAAAPPRLAETLLFAALAALWVEGQGIHLAANAIDNLIEGLARSGAVDLRSTDVYALAHDLDERLSHVMWHLGVIGLGGLLVAHEWRAPSVDGAITGWGLTAIGGLLYGFTLFAIFLEGQAVVLGLPAVAAAALVGLVTRRQLDRRPVAAFVFVSGLLALLLLAGWGVYWGGFPQFSDVGLI